MRASATASTLGPVPRSLFPEILMIRPSIARALCGVAFAASLPCAFADEVCSSTVPLTAVPDVLTTATLPRFDPALGELASVRVVVDLRLQPGSGIENTTGENMSVTSSFRSTAVLHLPSGATLQADAVSLHFEFYPPFDGVLDFDGASGYTAVDSPAHQVETALTTGLAPFIGSGTIALPLDLLDNTFLNVTGQGGPPATVVAPSTVSVTVCYEFTPYVAFECAGDGTGTPCPCGNDTPPASHAGCAHSAGAGARLDGSGTAAVSSDSLVLSVTGLPSTTTGIFLQGTVAASGGAGVLAGDGLRCVAGTIRRLAVRSTTNGTLAYPAPGDPPLSVAGSVPPGAVLRYQVWYRDPAAYCTSDTFNWSGGLRVQWAP